MARTDYYGIQTPVLQATSQAIRTVNGTVGTIAPEDYPDLISAMHSQSDYDNVMAQLVEETTTPAAIASFTDGANNLPVKELICTINPTETGTGAKSPSNPYVIGGHTGINVKQLGKNLFPYGSIIAYTYEWYSGSKSLDDALYPFFLKGNTTYILHYVNSNSDAKPLMRVWKSDKTILNNQANVLNAHMANSTSNTLTWQSTPQYYMAVIASSANAVILSPTEDIWVEMRIQTGKGISTNAQIEVGSTSTTYEPYITPTTHTASFGQTVYGGELNVTTGVLTITQVKDKLSSVTNWQYDSSKPAFYGLKNDMYVYPSVGVMPDVKSEIYKTQQIVGWAQWASAPDYSIGVRSTFKYVVVKDSRYTTVSDFLTNVGDKYFTYPLETPITIQLDPIEVRTLLGSNNLYHDCNGNIEVTYRANGGLYVAQH